MEQWQDAASQQLRLLTGRLNGLLTKGLQWLHSEFGVDLGLKPELIPPWIILLAACSGLLLIIALWASLCRTIFRKRPASSTLDDGVEGKPGANKPLKAEEPKKKKKKAEKKAQPNGRAVAEAQEGATVCEERVPHQQPPPPPKTDKIAETKKSKKKAKAPVKESKAATGDGKEPEEGTWETKVSNKEKREQRKKDKNSSDGSASPRGGETPVNAPPDQPKVSAAPPAPANQKKKKGESAKVKAEKADAVASQANSVVAAEVAAAATDMAVKAAPQNAAPKTSSWSSQRQPGSLWRAGVDESWSVPINSAELNLVSLGLPQPQPVSDLSWLSLPKVDDEWSGLNGGSADPSSDWNAPSEAWGNYEEPTPEPPQAQELPLPEPARVNLIVAADDNEDDKDKGDAATDGAGKTKKKKKKKKKTPEEGGAPGPVEEPVKEVAPAVAVKKQPPVQENAAAVQPVKAAAVEARADRPVKDVLPQKPPVTQVPQKPVDGEPAAKQSNPPAPTQQKKSPRRAKCPNQRRRRRQGERHETPPYARDFISCSCNTFFDRDLERRSPLTDFTRRGGETRLKTKPLLYTSCASWWILGN
ncbi:protein LYRIC-like isoform X2 [Cyprinodon tularosa]|uniref:protein LYRIC-like isoform X2 n=1 Tax=Cyprinodon tularosa TaxID=77115 RepID=UPI0018E1F4FC|nr:protein LYRIC-like isoform X2 [Cyprinodon tularosa]